MSRSGVSSQEGTRVEDGATAVTRRRPCKRGRTIAWYWYWSYAPGLGGMAPTQVLAAREEGGGVEARRCDAGAGDWKSESPGRSSKPKSRRPAEQRTAAQSGVYALLVSSYSGTRRARGAGREDSQLAASAAAPLASPLSAPQTPSPLTQTRASFEANVTILQQQQT